MQVVSGVILAAGTSSRMGRPKQLLLLDGRILLQYVVDLAAKAELDEILVVLGHRAPEIRERLELPSHGRIVLNEDFASGQASSLRAGLAAANREATSAVVLMGDQPGVPPRAVRRVLDAYRRTGGPVVRAYYGDVPGHPVVLGRAIWDEVVREGRDEGARAAFGSHPEWIVIERFEESLPAEVDTPEEFEALKAARRKSGGEDKGA